jgi:hypothetical protein
MILENMADELRDVRRKLIPDAFAFGIDSYAIHPEVASDFEGLAGLYTLETFGNLAPQIVVAPKFGFDIACHKPIQHLKILADGDRVIDGRLFMESILKRIDDHVRKGAEPSEEAGSFAMAGQRGSHSRARMRIEHIPFAWETLRQFMKLTSPLVKRLAGVRGRHR